MNAKEIWDLANEIGSQFEAVREAIAELRKKLEDATTKLVNKDAIDAAQYGICGKQPSATQVFAAINLAQAIDKVHAAEWSFGGEFNGAKHEALNAIVALSREEAEKAAKEADEKNA